MQFTIDFFRVSATSDEERFDFSAGLSALVGQTLVSRTDVLAHELKYLTRHRQHFEGAVLKYRMSNLPKKGRPGAVERDLGLRDDEGIIEKSHFLLHPASMTLLLQRNRYASGPNKVPELLSQFLNARVTLLPLMQPDGLRRMLEHRDSITELKIVLAGPTAAQIDDGHSPEDGWQRSLMQLYNDADSSRVEVRLKGNRRCHDGRRYVNGGMLDQARQLLGSNTVATLQAWFDGEEGSEGFIDALSDRYSEPVEIPEATRTPASDEIWSAMRTLWDSRRAFLATLRT